MTLAGPIRSKPAFPRANPAPPGRAVTVGKAQRTPPASSRAGAPAVERASYARVVCAFCHGKGRDPFNLMSPLSTCQVCGGTGSRQLHPPLAPCAFCKGTGISPGLRMTCTTCKGVGTVEIPIDARTCPGCGGTGRAADSGWPDSPLSCHRCKGKGVV